MKKLNLADQEKIASGFYIPFYKETYTDDEFKRCGIAHIHHNFSEDEFLKKVKGEFVDIGRKKAEAVTLLTLEQNIKIKISCIS